MRLQAHDQASDALLQCLGRVLLPIHLDPTHNLRRLLVGTLLQSHRQLSLAPIGCSFAAEDVAGDDFELGDGAGGMVAVLVSDVVDALFVAG